MGCMDGVVMQFTPTDFLRECAEFRKVMGLRTFWQLPEDTRLRALGAITLVYLNTEPTDKWPDAKLSRTYLLMSDEYQRREAMSVKNGLAHPI